MTSPGTPTPRFGDLIENTVASFRNPRRVGRFVRVIHRPRGRMNSGTWWQLTDGCGDFWEVQPQHLRVMADMPDVPAELDRLASMFTLREAAKQMEPDAAEHLDRLLVQFGRLRRRVELCDRFHVTRGDDPAVRVDEARTGQAVTSW